MTHSQNHHPLTSCKELHIAPMLNVSKPEFLSLMRILTKKAILWTEMIADKTVVNAGDLDQHLGLTPALHPIICQIGGRDASNCAEATRLLEDYGYREVNLNIGCPSNHTSGRRQFGAMLMKQVNTAVEVVSAMSSNVKNIPVSVKTRVGVDELDTLEYLIQFIGRLRNEAGCRKFIIHARKCVLGGLLSPEQNRIIPPLNYPRVYALCDHFTDCTFVLNGGIPGLDAAKQLCHGTFFNNHPYKKKDAANVNNKKIGLVNDLEEEKEKNMTHIDSQDHDVHAVPCSICKASNGSCTVAPVTVPPNLIGCMLGRAAMDNPCMFWDVDRFFYGEVGNPCQNRREVMIKYCEYLERTYPRRCCDNDERTTFCIPAPNVTKKLYGTNGGGCDICKEFYGELLCFGQKELMQAVSTKSGKVKISSRVIDRALKPIYAIFFGLPMKKAFQRECDRLSKELNVRNCGPGYMIRKAMHIIPVTVLDAPFIRTEDLGIEDVPNHVAPTLHQLTKCQC
eukprot:CAMPEP_0171300252 /NCGR_PEP_ID=MMETSP0816-20121228/9034_1 /TAXON_ID=420281 /ORGANISM="Proboscia inermis, Strain CCAP1064/1" /LENGTH=507 /DNA_ID=CAMNT_0011776593 /DNA_START=82 /DNA_END=1605 /DNA_ORIENTATION=+